jgi:hypothetical protein
VVVVRVTISQLLATDLALDKLGARGISAGDVRQLIGNDHVVASNPRGGGQSDTRRLLLGVTDGGRAQPGDFDADLAKLDPRYRERRDGDPDARLIVLAGIEGEDAQRLERIAEARGQTAADVVAELLREAARALA